MMQLGDVVGEIAKRYEAASLMRLITDNAIAYRSKYLDEVRRDMRYSLRAMLKSPGFALVASFPWARNGADDRCVQLGI